MELCYDNQQKQKLKTRERPVAWNELKEHIL